MRAPKNKAPRLEGALPKLINVATCNQLVINRWINSIDKAKLPQETVSKVERGSHGNTQ